MVRPCVLMYSGPAKSTTVVENGGASLTVHEIPVMMVALVSNMTFLQISNILHIVV